MTPSVADGAPGPVAGPSDRLRITLVNQFYPPDLAPTAHLTASLAEFLADRGHTVTVITGGAAYVDAPRSHRRRRSRGVSVQHLWTPNLGRASVLARLSDYVTFLVGATVRLVTMARQDVIISLTTPPYVVVAALAHRVRHRRSRVILWSMDCYPDVIERLGSRTSGSPRATSSTGDRQRPAPARRSVGPSMRQALGPILSLRRDGPLSQLLRAVNRAVFRRLDAVVALDQAMADLLVAGYAVDAQHPPVQVVPNWEALDAFPGPSGGTTVPTRWEGYEDPDLADRFVVLYLGNLGYGHPVEAVLDAADHLDEDVAWLFVGGGARWSQLDDHAARPDQSSRIVRRPYVAKERTDEVMAGADCALILLADEALGVMSPSKLHANLAAGLPILYVGPEGSNVDVAIARFGCGVSLRPGDRDGLLAAVRRLRDDEPWRHDLSVAARTAFESSYCDRITLPQWAEVVEARTHGPDRPGTMGRP